MAITINGSGTITGVSAGGLPDNCITADDLATTLDLSGNTITLPSGTGGKVLGYKRIFDGAGTNVTVANTWVNIACSDVNYTVVGDNSTFIYSLNLNKESDWTLPANSAHRVKYSLNGATATVLTYMYGDSGSNDEAGERLTSINVMIPSSIGASAGDSLVVEVDFIQNTSQSSYFNQVIYTTQVASGDFKANGYIMELA